MAKPGRPAIPYESFVEVWERLAKEGRAGTNAANDILGGSKSTIAAYRERYERDKASKAISIIKSVELTEAVHKAIAEIKVKEIDALERVNMQLKTRLDECILAMRESEEKLGEAKVDIEDARINFEADKLAFERKLAAAEARIMDFAAREKVLNDRCEQLAGEYTQARQEAAVARKEVEMLREVTKKLPKG